jgi:Rod binding domain-containing protein
MPNLSISNDLRSPLDAAVFSRDRGSDERADFASILGRVRNTGDEDPATVARRSAESFVSITLVQPLLKQLRESNHTPPPFGPTSGEKQFQGLMDAELAQRVVKAAHFPLVDRITGDLLKRSQSRAGSTDAAGPAPGLDDQESERMERP